MELVIKFAYNFCIACLMCYGTIFFEQCPFSG